MRLPCCPSPTSTDRRCRITWLHMSVCKRKWQLPAECIEKACKLRVRGFIRLQFNCKEFKQFIQLQRPYPPKPPRHLLETLNHCELLKCESVCNLIPLIWLSPYHSMRLFLKCQNLSSTTVALWLCSTWTVWLNLLLVQWKQESLNWRLTAVEKNSRESHQSRRTDAGKPPKIKCLYHRISVLKLSYQICFKWDRNYVGLWIGHVQAC